MTPDLPAGCTIALLGEDGPDATALASDLTERLAARGLSVRLVRAIDADTQRCDFALLIAGDAAETQHRSVLARSQLPFAVVHGQGAERLAAAWNAINRIADPEARDPDATSGRWEWACDKCSDSTCEHRLFTDLVAQRP